MKESTYVFVRDALADDRGRLRGKMLHQSGRRFSEESIEPKYGRMSKDPRKSTVPRKANMLISS
jgi:hypothetical protein